ncbi:hypothetical protein C1645_821572 [Glomus cerebriforme]|uniref:Uncharacterized protein n=1 Tax=Glomus cerebriforme TaxID=658196 RepID=A0A397T322_9GLOM|nr:hypothetical protein C1645_821572 [Glomus cerebriforme]
MNNAIPISILNVTDQLSFTPIDENPDINNPEVVEEVLKYIGKLQYGKSIHILVVTGNLWQSYLALMLPTQGIFVYGAFVQKKILETVKSPPGHTKPSLLQIIPLDYYVPDELHIMLRI